MNNRKDGDCVGMTTEQVAQMEHQQGSKSLRRLGIYCFYDRNGHAAPFIDVFLDDLTKHLADLVVVVNGKLDQQSRTLFRKYTDRIIMRDNKGLDVAAYRQVMLTLGWEKLAEYDEVICLNDTILGPVYPFQEMFDVMDTKNVDFWGITTYTEEHVGTRDEIPTHLQAYWHAYRRSMVQSEQFQQYWENLPAFESYADVTHKHEIPFTQHFADLGFVWASYIDCDKYSGQTHYPLLYTPMQLVRDERCPVFKRRVFFLDYDFYFDHTAGQPASDLYEYIDEHTDYDTGLIWDALLQSYNIRNVAQTMHLDYVLPSRAENPRKAKASLRSAFIFHVYFLDLLHNTFHYISQIPDETDLYITTMEEKIEPIRQAMLQAGLNRQVTFIPVKNRGRDVSALLVGARDVVNSGKYDVIGFAHDKKSSQNQETGHNGTETEGFSYKLMENTLGSQAYVRNVLTLFADNPRLGLACPPPPYHALYFAHTMPNDWGPNFDITKELLERRLHLHVPLDKTKGTRSAMGSCYWFRVEALKPLFDYQWKYEDFLPEGKMGADGSISHAIERANGYIAQSQGFYPAWVLSDRYARIEVDSLFYTTNTMLNALGGTRNGETLLATAGNMRSSLTVFGGVRHTIHRVLQVFAALFIRPLPQSAQDVVYKGGWGVIHAAFWFKGFVSSAFGKILHK